MDNSYAQKMAPPRMNDYRYVTDLRPNAELISSIRFHNNLYDSNQYRQFMINNAEKMMKMNQDFYKQKNKVDTCGFVHPDPNGNDSFFAAYRKYMYGQPTYEYNDKPYN